MGVPQGDAEKGKKLFIQRCSHCHTVDADCKPLKGPTLRGIVGRKAGTAPGYDDYTEANKSKDIVWTKQNLSEYLANPRKFIPGTKTVKVFSSVKKEADRADLIAYLGKQK